LRRKTEIEMRRAALAKTARSLVRLKHSLAADEELNEILPETLAEFDGAVARGELVRHVETRIDALIRD
jgi:hypothetical protein